MPVPKILHKLLSATVILLLFGLTFSCSKHDQPAALSPCYLLSVATSTNAESFTYGDGFKLTEVTTTEIGGSTDTGAATYDAHGNLTLVVLSGDSIISTYDSQNKLTTQLYGASQSVKDVYEYNSAGQVTKISSYYLNNGTYLLDYYYTYTFSSPSSRNVSIIKMYSNQDVLTESITYEFDTHPNEFGTNPEFIPVFWFVGFNNNVIKSTNSGADGTVYNIETVTYTYNEKGYPLTSTTVSSTSSTVATRTFTYFCE